MKVEQRILGVDFDPFDQYAGQISQNKTDGHLTELSLGGVE